MPNSIFFSQKGDRNSQFITDCQSENFEYKNLMCNALIPKDKIRGRVLVNKSLRLNGMLIKSKFP